MLAYGAYVGGVCPYYYVPAMSAFAYCNAVAREDKLVLYVVEELAITLVGICS